MSMTRTVRGNRRYPPTPAQQFAAPSGKRAFKDKSAFESNGMVRRAAAPFESHVSQLVDYWLLSVMFALHICSLGTTWRQSNAGVVCCLAERNDTLSTLKDLPYQNKNKTEVMGMSRTDHVTDRICL